MSEILTAIRLAGVSLVICSLFYPLVVVGLAQWTSPWTSEGSLIRTADGKLVGSILIAQPFTRPEYFWPRPSAVAYNASASGGSNLFPTNPLLTERAAATLRKLQLSRDETVPADLVTASGSGLDPHITRASALVQAKRVSNARGVPLEQLVMSIDAAVTRDLLENLGGEPLVNVLELNLRLDAAAKRP